MKPELKKKVLRRLKLIEGQVRGLSRMVEEEKYCVDVITQLLAAKQAISGVENFVLENHLKICAIDQMRSGKEAQASAEILKIYKLAKKK